MLYTGTESDAPESNFSAPPTQSVTSVITGKSVHILSDIFVN